MQYRDINSIEPYKKNAKLHPKAQVNQIAMSIKEFGFNQPIVVDKKGVIIVGHGRHAAARELGLTEVPVMEIDVTEEQANAYRLADNKTNESDWDMILVIEELKDLDSKGFDITLTGFDRDLIVDEDEHDDDVPVTPEEAQSKLGDIYQLGSHKVMCGDSVVIEDVAKLMDGHKADLIFTDPPYNVNYKGKGKNTSEGIENDKMSEAEFDIFLNSFFTRFVEVAKKSAPYYVFHSHKTQEQFERSMNNNGIEVVTQLIWNKPSAGMGMGEYRTKHEPFFYAKLAGQKVNFYGDRTGTTIWDFQKGVKDLERWAKKVKAQEAEGRNTIWSMKRENVMEYVHPTQKPVEIITKAIINSSKTDDIVLDLFLGSGATMIGAEKTNRVCYGMELDPKYTDVIVQRYVDYTGNEDIIKNGESIIWQKTKEADQQS